jgi:hypothetical protein
MPSGAEGEGGRERERGREEGTGAGDLVICSRKSEESDATDTQTGREAARERGGQAGQTLGVLPKLKFLASLLLLLPSFTACWRRSAGLTWLPDAFSLAVKLRT